MIIWLAGLFGGLGIGFIGGFFFGAWAQRTLASQLERWVEMRDDRRKQAILDKLEYKAPPGAAWGGQEIPGKGEDHPAGAPPPSPEEVRNRRPRNPVDWRSKLKTGMGGK